VANQLNVQAHQALLSIRILIFNNIRIDYLKFHLKIPKAFCLTPGGVAFLERKNKSKAIKSRIMNSINQITVVLQKRLVLWINLQLLKILKKLLS
jgi:hypothetical protein